MVYIPDGHAFLCITSMTDSPMYKIMGSWSGGYLDGDSWRLNSGISRIEDKGDTVEVHGHSGSSYVVSKKGRGLNAHALGILNQVIGDATDYTITQVTLEEVMEGLANASRIYSTLRK